MNKQPHRTGSAAFHNPPTQSAPALKMQLKITESPTHSSKNVTQESLIYTACIFKYAQYTLLLLLLLLHHPNKLHHKCFRLNFTCETETLSCSVRVVAALCCPASVHTVQLLLAYNMEHYNKM